MRRLTVLLILAVALVGCSRAPAEGTVTGAQHHAAWMQWIAGTSGTTTCSGTPPTCRSTPGVPGHFMFWPERWEIEITNGDEHGWTDVGQDVFNHCPNGSRYPNCYSGGRR